MIALAVGAARAVTTRDSATASRSDLDSRSLSTDRMGLAVPVVVGGRVVAVVYADAVTLDGHDRPVPSCWPELIEVLARHAGRCLEALTTQKTATPKITTRQVHRVHRVHRVHARCTGCTATALRCTAHVR